MKIKKKLLLGFGLLFIMVIVFGAVSIYYIKVISETSSITLKNNYATLTFTRQMRTVLDENDLPLNASVAATFNQALKKQENNITEPGESAATANLRKAFLLLATPSLTLKQQEQAERDVRLQLKDIEGLNMHAIEVKNNFTHSTVDNSTVYLGGMVFITFLILFVLIVNFPGFILNPLGELANGLQQISKKNYDTRLYFKTSEEFTRLADAFNAMATQLGEQENADLTKLIAAELRIKTLIEEMPDAVIGLNEKQEILFINQEAKKMLNLNEKSVIGQSVAVLAKNNQLLTMFIADTESSLKTAHFQQKTLKVTVPNLKPDLDSLTVASYAAGTIHVFKAVGV
ncbi:HAMP domain-containing protein [Mucilaginibacter sp. FT3.2]|uniref:HAMP domain-containing protein n=1 Tax=Mucilaginibacter sp. FT3.2 TaxID=2723090 RepID=UPI0016228E1D|nr:HAMP domain-containing protein [Mucilaginibacter sp. FT3.2]MBB6231167.1 nitrogen fixation/metabolism regulation signal transduction histidine kinase [Mucilaginibacter sp. FT3.2]